MGLWEVFRSKPGFPLKSTRCNLPSTLDHPKEVSTYIKKEVAAHCIVKLNSPYQVWEWGIHFSPLRVIPKKGKPNQWRLIMELLILLAWVLMIGFPKNLFLPTFNCRRQSQASTGGWQRSFVCQDGYQACISKHPSGTRKSPFTRLSVEWLCLNWNTVSDRLLSYLLRWLVFSYGSWGRMVFHGTFTILMIFSQLVPETQLNILVM